MIRPTTVQWVIKINRVIDLVGKFLLISFLGSPNLSQVEADERREQLVARFHPDDIIHNSNEQFCRSKYCNKPSLTDKAVQIIKLLDLT